MKLADIMAAADQAFPNFEFEIERKGGAKPVTVLFRSTLRLSPERRAEVMEHKAEAAEGDTLTKQAESEKAALSKLVEDEAHIEEIEEIFSQSPDDRDILWIQLGRTYAEATQVGEAKPSQ